MTRPLAELARARSGDKGDIVDISLFAADEPTYELLRAHVTAQRVRAHFADRVRGEVTRWELPRLRALKFVLQGALDGGASRSLRSDNLGKCFGPALLRMEIEV
ncbi:MAG: hypothetical protein FJX76_11525 [Armatimonadetes bacterium]|nr:hypothetical protein [Armatimonadota bacterium]